MIAALFVEPSGVYAGLPGVEVWDEQRDARTYSGPYPVIAHPPCERWGRLWHMGGNERGADCGTFAAALDAVRKWGGILEHPADSTAWDDHGLNRPPEKGGWVPADWLWGHEGWSCCVYQGHYGHRAPKRTWLYAHGLAELPELVWGPADPGGRVEQMCRQERIRTPAQFRDLLLDLVATHYGGAA